MSAKEELLREEEHAWEQLHGLVHGLTPEQSMETGYDETGRSAKDVLGHIACWQAEAAQVLCQIRQGTYEERDEDEDALDARFQEAIKDLSHDDVVAQIHAARSRMLEELEAVPEEKLDDETAGWFQGWGAVHYRQHLPRLREWVGQLTGGL